MKVDELKQLIEKKSSLVMQLEVAKRTSGVDVVALATEAAHLEGLIAIAHVEEKRHEKAVANMISQASCLVDARKTGDALAVLMRTKQIAPTEQLRAWIESEVNRLSHTTPSIHLSWGRKRVCMITRSHYESGSQVARIAEMLAQRGYLVHVLALRRGSDLLREETIKGVRIFRIQERSKQSFVWRILRYFLVSSSWVTRLHRRQHYDLVYVHSAIDLLVYAAWYPKLTGAKIILHIHNIVPEFYKNRFTGSERSALISGLKLVERVSAAFADHVILANPLWLDKYTRRSASKEKCSVFLDYVDSSLKSRERDYLKLIDSLVERSSSPTMKDK